MNASKSSGNFKPFDDLNLLMKKKASKRTPNGMLKKSSSRRRFPASIDESPNKRDEDEHHLFMKAMADVTPIERNKNETRRQKKAANHPSKDSEPEILRHLDNLIKHGSNFVVSLTPEYIEGTACNVPYEIVRKLHQGDFSIQDYIDLHGYVSREAYNALDSFLKQSILNGLRTVLIIHGRGLSSVGNPVLKNNITKWLTRGKWRKWVSAYASARLCDGGTGGTYVLLRNRPLPKRLLKKLIQNG